ncbi:MAG: HAD family hydrolase [Candidatus Saccharimonadales bacterium]
MIKAIIFDCFGVLTTDGWLKFLDTYLPEGGNRTKAKILNHQVDKGVIAYKDFINQVAALADIDRQIVNDDITEHLAKNQLLFDYIRDRIKPKYKLGILSNIAMPDWFREHFSEQELSLFDDILLSSEVGMVKPEPEIFRLSAKRLKVEPSECVFIDDREPNIEVAKSLGMEGIFYQDFQQMKTELEHALTPVADN